MWNDILNERVNMDLSLSDTQTISILGCGWLGGPVAEKLVKDGASVKGSTTDPEKLKDFRNKGIDSFLITVDLDHPNPIDPHFFESDILFITIPFKRSYDDPRVYLDQIKYLIPFIETSPISLVVLASTTSVYPEDGSVWTEEDVLIPKGKRAEVMVAAENLILQNDHFEGVVLRFSGLLGPNRFPNIPEKGRRVLKDPESPMNLVHLDDCVEIVSQIVKGQWGGEIFNVVSDDHPSRREFYEALSRHLSVDPPLYHTFHDVGHRIVSNAKVREFLDYAFHYPDPLTMFEK